MPDTTEVTKVDAPVDSDEYPVAVLVQGDDIANTWCDGFPCAMHASDWPDNGRQSAGGKPGVMYRGALYCSDCKPYAFAPFSGERVRSLTGEPD